MSEKIRILLIINPRMVREGIGLLLGEERGIEVVGGHEHADELEAHCREETPDVVVVELAETDAEAQVARLRRLCPKARFIGVAATDDVAYASKAVSLGLSAVYVQTQPSGILLDMVVQAAAGKTVTPAQAGPRRVSFESRDGDDGFLVGRLTPRELEVLQELSGGKPTQAVAEALGISPLTVQSHVKSILSKLGVHSKIDAVTLAFRQGLAAHSGAATGSAHDRGRRARTRLRSAL